MLDWQILVELLIWRLSGNQKKMSVMNTHLQASKKYYELAVRFLSENELARVAKSQATGLDSFQYR